MANIKPLEDRVLVQIVEAETTTASGLVIPDSAAEKPQEAVVIAVGPGRWEDDDDRIPMDVKEGDTVVFSRYGGTELQRAEDAARGTSATVDAFAAQCGPTCALGADPAGAVRAIIDEAELLLIAVDPACRRRGVAGALMRSMLAECRGRGVRRVHLEVRANNPAVALYAAHGFVKAGERCDYYRAKSGESFDAHTYARDV